MNKEVKNNVLARLVVLVFVGMIAVSCSKYDKMSILGEWTIDLKEALSLKVDSAKESLLFESGSAQTYTESHYERNVGLTTWVIKGTFDRKNNKITFSNRVKEDSGESMIPETFKYRIEDDKLILIVKDKGFANDEKIYTKKKGF